MLDSDIQGTVYFMVEKDLFGYPSGPYVKIGLVSENDLGRSAFDRRDEHQTGNPREIIVKDQVQTKASVSTLENLIHQRLTSKRIHGEWFSYGEDGIETYVQLAKEINQQLESQLDNERRILDLGKLEENGNEITPSSEILDLFEELKAIQVQMQELKFKKDLIELKFKSLGGNDPRNINGICYYQLTKPQRRFDTKRFKLDHIDIVEKISKEVITPRFKVKNILKKMITDEYEDLLEICNSQNLERDRFSELERDKNSEELHCEWLNYHSSLQPLALKKTFLENKLKLFTGENSSIEGVCSWSRKPTLKFTKTDVQKYDTDLANSYVITGEPTLRFRVNVFRPYHF